MSCNKVQITITELLDSVNGARGEARAHVGTCRNCNDAYRVALELRGTMRSMPRPQLPVGLNEKLRVLASHERQRRIMRESFASRVRHLAARARLSFDNMMRPVALPVTGGLLSALLAFVAVFSPMATSDQFRNDVSIMLFTQPDGEVANWAHARRHTYDIPRIMPVDSDEIDPDATVVELTIDPEGRVADFSLERGEFTDEAKSVVLFSKFSPATSFGRPTWGKTLLVISHPSTAKS
jgi:hypothetical protein